MRASGTFVHLSASRDKPIARRAMRTPVFVMRWEPNLFQSCWRLALPYDSTSSPLEIYFVPPIDRATLSSRDLRNAVGHSSPETHVRPALCHHGELQERRLDSTVFCHTLIREDGKRTRARRVEDRRRRIRERGAYCKDSAGQHTRRTRRLIEGQDSILWIHILLMMLSFGIIFPTGMVLGVCWTAAPTLPLYRTDANRR